MIYLATPYSHPDPAVRERRFHVANRVAAELFNAGEMVFSPISQTHPISLAGNLPKDWSFWARYDEKILSFCTRMIVLMQDGWEESAGVQAELEIARDMNIPIEYRTP